MIKEFSFLGFPMEPLEIRELVWQYAQENDIKGFGDKGIAGKDWFSFFMKRHASAGLSIKSASDLSVERAENTEGSKIDKWFNRYEEVLAQSGEIGPEQIWNVDEHGCEDKIKVKRVVGVKGIRAHQKQPREKSLRSTMLTYINAAGDAVPPMIIHKGKFHDSWRTGAPRPVMVKGSKKGYINKFLFALYGKRFIHYLNQHGMLDRTHILLIDCHTSHVFNYCFMGMMYTRGIKVMALEPHTSHFAQPLDKNPFSSFKEKFNRGMRRFNRTTGGRPIKKEEFFSVFNPAWEQAMTPENIRAGFKRTGIWPVNRHVFPPEMFKISENSKQMSCCGSEIVRLGLVMFLLIYFFVSVDLVRYL